MIVKFSELSLLVQQHILYYVILKLIKYLQDHAKSALELTIHIKRNELKNKVMTEIDPTKMRQDIVDYIMKIISSSEKNAKGLRSMADRGFSEKGMLEKVIEVTAIQSDQLKTLAQAVLVYVKSDEFFSKLCMSLALQHEEEQKTV